MYVCKNIYSLQEKGARVIVSILDCCLVFKYEAKTRGGGAQKIGMDNSDVAEGSFVLYACQDNDKAIDGDGPHGKKEILPHLNSIIFFYLFKSSIIRTADRERAKALHEAKHGSVHHVLRNQQGSQKAIWRQASTG